MAFKWKVQNDVLQQVAATSSDGADNTIANFFFSCNVFFKRDFIATMADNEILYIENFPCLGENNCSSVCVMMYHYTNP